MTAQRADPQTLCALSAMAFVAACLAHEAVGHGGACLLSGGNIKLLTSVYFKCYPSPPLVDAAGPSMNLAVACAAAVALRSGSGSFSVRVFLALLLAFNGFWGAGYFVFSGITNTGDWSFVLRELSLEPRWAWRVVMVVVGVWLYVITMRLAGPHLPRGRPLGFAYLVAGLVACGSTLFFFGEKGPALLEAAQESLLAALGLPLLALKRNPSSLEASGFLPRSPKVQALALGVVVVFCLTLGRGLAGA